MNKRFIKKAGVFRYSEEEVLLYRILDVTIKMGFWQRIFKLGTLILATSDKTDPTVVIKNIKNVRVFKNNLSENVEKERMRMRIRTGELIDSGEMEYIDDQDM